MSEEEQTNDVMSWCGMDCCGPVGMEDTDMQEWMDLCGQMMDKCMSYMRGQADSDSAREAEPIAL